MALDSRWVRQEVSTFLHIEMPGGFDAECYDEIRQLGQLYPGNSTGPAFLRAMNAMAYRYRAMHEAQREFAGSLVVGGLMPAPEERFIQEKALVHFFFDGVSCVEALAFSAYAIGAHLIPAKFPFDEKTQSRIDLAFTSKAFASAWSEEPLTKELAGIENSSEWKNLKQFRNLLSHRGHPTRTFEFPDGAEGSIETSIQADFLPIRQPNSKPPGSPFPMSLDLEFFSSRRRWLDQKVSQTLRELHQFMTGTAEAARKNL